MLEKAEFWNAVSDGDIYPSSSLFIGIDYVRFVASKMFPWIISGILFGSVSIYLFIHLKSEAREKRGESKNEEYRGLSVTISTLPTMGNVVLDTKLKVKLPKMSAEYLNFVDSSLRYLNHNSHVNINNISLIDHTISMMQEALDLKEKDPLLPLVISSVLASAVNKPDIYKLSDSSKFITKLDAWYELNLIDRKLVLYSIKYQDADLPIVLPGIDDENLLRLKKIIEAVKNLTVAFRIKDPKEKTAPVFNLEEEVFSAFREGFFKMIFQAKGNKRGQPADGWRVDSKLYLIEHRVHDICSALLSEKAVSELAKIEEKCGEHSAFNQVLFKVLYEKELLVLKMNTYLLDGSEAGEEELSPENPLWNIWAGRLEMKNILVVEFPEEERGIYPKETSYKIQAQFPSEFPFGDRESTRNSDENKDGKSAQATEETPTDTDRSAPWDSNNTNKNNGKDIIDTVGKLENKGESKQKPNSENTFPRETLEPAPNQEKLKMNEENSEIKSAEKASQTGNVCEDVVVQKEADVRLFLP